MADTRGTILIVDDEPATIELLSDYLGGKRLAVARAHNLDEALAELDRERPDVVLISLRLGEADGLEVLQRIREVNVQVGLLVMAEQEDAGRAKEALALGAMDYLLKPIDFDFLNRAIEKALSVSAPMIDYAETPTEPAAALTPSGLLYALALEVFRATRPFSPEARASVGSGLEQAALAAMQRSVGGEKAEIIRALNQVRNMIRFALDLGDISAETAGRLDEHMARARRSVGLS
ncbi:MAG: response regulator [Candidatus Rokubacteria bacterium]|nr:response regulator [Candidatus Rokubacteria bacterium]